MSLINEHDMTKKMLDVMREFNVKGLMVNENTPMSSSEGGGDSDVEMDRGAVEPESGVIEAEQKKFRETVTPRVNFGKFVILPKDNNVIMIGELLEGIQFQFTLDEKNGIYIITDSLQLTPEVVELIQKLYGYYQNWSNEWAEKIATDYKVR